MPQRETWVLILTVVELLALALLIGGLVVIVYAVIPAVFNVGLPTEAGGRLLTRAFGGYNELTAGAIGTLIAATVYRFWVGEPSSGQVPAIGTAEPVLLALLACAFGVIVLWLRPEAMALQEQAFAARGAEEKTAAYEAFFRIHNVARALYMVNLGLGIALLAVKVKRLCSANSLSAGGRESERVKGIS